MTRFGMAIDLQKCAGCGACGIACKVENNIDKGMFWGHHLIEEQGAFPNYSYHYKPTLCNHCTDAACVRVCPTGAMHKSPEGVTLHDAGRCIGCKSCMMACPYDVINYNIASVTPYWESNKAAVPGATSTFKELQGRFETPTPYANMSQAAAYPVLRERGTVEKCTLCYHRTSVGDVPYCVEACPGEARFFGDLDDPQSEVSRVIARFGGEVLKPEAGTGPAVYYVREF